MSEDYENDIDDFDLDPDVVLNGLDESYEPSRILIKTFPVKILFVASNPKEQEELNQSGERDKIAEVFISKPNYQFKSRFGVTRQTLLKYIMGIEPHILHFSAHGNLGLVALDNGEGYSDFFQLKKLGDLINAHNRAQKREKKNILHGVVLSSCFSKTDAENIADKINFVIAMTREISTIAVDNFIVGFYEVLTSGKSIRSAYEYALSLIDSHEEDIPILLPENKDFTDRYLVK